MTTPTFRVPNQGDFLRIYEIVGSQLDPEDVADARVMLEGPLAQPDAWVCAEIDGEIAAVAVVVPATCRVGASQVDALSIELVATAAEHQGRGLQRAVFTEIERRWSDTLVQFVEGIPYFYRRLGYEYAIPHPNQQVTKTPSVPDGFTVEVLGPGDVEWIEEVQSPVLGCAGVSVGHGSRLWEWILASALYRTVRVRRDGEVGMARAYRMDDTAFVMEVTGGTQEAVVAAVAAAADGADTVRVYHRPGTPEIAALGGELFEASYAYYAKATNPVGVLRALDTEFGRRLADAGLGDYSGTVRISFYRWSVTLRFEGGALVDVQEGERIEAPISKGYSAVPPDMVTQVLLGTRGVEALAAHHPDLMLGGQKAIMSALFPPLTADVQTWVAP